MTTTAITDRVRITIGRVGTVLIALTDRFFPTNTRISLAIYSVALRIQEVDR